MWHLRLVEGDSMLPAYRSGQAIIVSHSRAFGVGDVVIVFADNKELIKRVAKQQNGQVYVLGDNPTKSRDSRQFGWINDRHVIGKVIWPRKPKRTRARNNKSTRPQ